MKKFITHSITICILSMIGLVGVFGVCKGQRSVFSRNGLSTDDPSVGTYLECDGKTDLGNCTSIKEDEKGGDRDTIIRRLLEVFGLKSAKSDDLKFKDYAMAILNMALGLVSFIALIMTIYTFYMMFFTENEAGIKKAKGNLFGIFIALVIIGLAWIIVSFIFRWYESNWKDNEEAIQKRTDIANIGEFG